MLNHAAYLVLAPHQPRPVLAYLALLPRHALLGCPAAYQGDDDDEAQVTRGNSMARKDKGRLVDIEMMLTPNLTELGTDVASRAREATQYRSLFARR